MFNPTLTTSLYPHLFPHIKEGFLKEEGDFIKALEGN